MSQPKTYLFYDLETSGLNPAFDQILQFAAIRTDTNFQEISEYEFRIKLRPDVIPSPKALLTTDVSVLKAITTGICEYDAVREIHRLVNEPNTINIGYNSLNFDDKFLRFAFYRNLLSTYTHQFKNGCKRLDIFPITVLYWLQKSPLLTWPTIDGDPTLRLEHLSQENNLAKGPAHDALVDVRATIELARRLRQDKDLWHSSLSFLDKASFTQRLTQLTKYATGTYALLIDSKFGYGCNCQVPVLYLGETNHNGSYTHWLRLDQSTLQETTANTIAETTWATSKKAGEPPFMLPHEPNQISQERLEIVRSNIKWLKENPELLAAITNFHLNRIWPEREIDLDAALYDYGFPQPPIEALCHEFHQADIEGKMRLIPHMQDMNRQSLAVRLLCRNFGLGHHYPAYAAYEKQIRDNERPLFDFRGKPRLTPEAALAHIEKERLEDLTPRQQTILLDLEQYIRYHFRGQSWEI